MNSARLRRLTLLTQYPRYTKTWCQLVNVTIVINKTLTKERMQYEGKLAKCEVHSAVTQSHKSARSPKVRSAPRKEKSLLKLLTVLSNFPMLRRAVFKPTPLRLMQPGDGGKPCGVYIPVNYHLIIASIKPSETVQIDSPNIRHLY